MREGARIYDNEIGCGMFGLMNCFNKLVLGITLQTIHMHAQRGIHAQARSNILQCIPTV